MRKILFCICLLNSIMIHGQIMVETITEEFEGSGGLNLDLNGILYVANFGESLDNGTGKEVWTIDYKNGQEPELFASGLNGASGNDFDSKGNLFQSNIAAGNISKISPDGLVTFFSSSGISCNVGINIDNEDNLFVCNCCGSNGNTIRKITKEGNSTLFSSSPLLSCPNGLTRDNSNNLYVSNFSNGNIVKITPEGVATLLAFTPGMSGASGASNGHIIYSEKEDVLYVASHGSHRIYKLTLDGELSILAGSGIRGNKDGSANEATFSRPNGLALSLTEDTLFVNSSIPITNANGRPLNPSVIRMLTGIRGLTATESLPVLDFSFVLNSAMRKIILKDIPKIHEAMEFALFSMQGQELDRVKINSDNSFAEISIPPNVISGVYFINITTSSGRSKTKNIFIK